MTFHAAFPPAKSTPKGSAFAYRFQVLLATTVEPVGELEIWFLTEFRRT